jgi:hypothetical protein
MADTDIWCAGTNDSVYFLTGGTEHFPLTATYIRKCLLVTHGEQPTAVKSSVTYSCKSQCHVSTGTFPALTEEGISGNTLQQQTFSAVATLS